jgi:hypothetical protein
MERSSGVFGGCRRFLAVDWVTARGFALFSLLFFLKLGHPQIAAQSVARANLA